MSQSASASDMDPSMVFSWVSKFGSKAKNTLAQLLIEDDEYMQHNISDVSAHPIETSSLIKAVIGEMKEQSYDFSHLASESVGKIRLRLISATKLGVSDAAEGDHYVTACIEEFECGGSANNTIDGLISQTVKTNIVKSSATPVFDKEWTFYAPSYQSCVKISLISSADDTVVGVAKVSVFALVVGKFGLSADDVSNGNNKENEMIKVPKEENISMRDLRNSTTSNNEIGFFTVEISFTEDVDGLFLSKKPRRIKLSGDEPLSVDRLVKHINRFERLINLAGDVYEEYLRLMNWDEPTITFISMFAFIFVVIYANAEYALSYPLFLFICLFTYARNRRTSGTYMKSMIEMEKLKSVPYRPVAIFKTSLLDTSSIGPPGKREITQASVPAASAGFSFWGLGGSSGSSSSSSSKYGNNTHTKPFVRVSYVTMCGDLSVLKKGKLDTYERKEFLVGDICTSHSDGKDTTYKNDASLRSCFIQNVFTPWPRRRCLDGDAVNGLGGSSSSSSGNSYLSLNLSSSAVSTASSKNASSSFSSAQRGGGGDEEEDLALVYPILQPLWTNVATIDEAIVALGAPVTTLHYSTASSSSSSSTTSQGVQGGESNPGAGDLEGQLNALGNGKNNT